MAREDNLEVKFYFLCLVGRIDKRYNLISKKVREKIDTILKGLTLEREGDINDPESWYIWKSKIPITINDSNEYCDIVIKHFKVRIIIEITRKYKEDNFVNIFKKTRKERDKLIDNDLIKNLLELKIDGLVEKIYFYPLIQIFKEFKSKHFKYFGDESISSFLYEVPDARRENLSSLLFASPKITIVRVSRPSIIASEMSNFMLSQIINVVYDTCLVSLRENHSNELSEKIFHDMRDYIGRVLFDHEETIASSELTRSVNTLSIIMSFGAIAAVLAIIIFPDCYKTFIGFILLIATIIAFSSFLRSKG